MRLLLWPVPHFLDFCAGVSSPSFERKFVNAASAICTVLYAPRQALGLPLCTVMRLSSITFCESETHDVHALRSSSSDRAMSSL